MNTVKQFKLFQSLFLALTMTVCASSAYAEESGSAKNEGSKVTWGPGLGIAYGVLGVNVDYSMADQVKLTGGLGTTLLAGAGYAFGFRYYFGERMRASLLYGTNTVINAPEADSCKSGRYGTTCGNSTNRAYQGFNLAVGMGHQTGPGWDFDVTLLLTSGATDEVDKLKKKGLTTVDMGSPLKISVGYHF